MSYRRPYSGAFAGAAIAAVFAACAPGCGAADRPPQEGALTGSTKDASTSTTFQPSQPTELSCNLGPDGGVCACADQPLLGDPPNLYFVLDRSGSMYEMNKWVTVVRAVGELVVQLGPRASYGATVFPDPMNDSSCGPGAEVFATAQGDAPAGTAGPVETKFIEVLGGLAPDGSTPTAATLLSVDARLKTLKGKTYVILATDGGPNCDPNTSCDASGCQLNIESAAKGCTPNGSLNCCSPAYQSDAQLNCEDSAATDAAVKQLAADGFPVYVMGIPGSEPYASLLNQLAIDGGTPQAGSVDDAGAAVANTTAYYAVSSYDLAAFTAKLSSIAASITATCTLTLNQAPPDPTMVNVFVDEQVVPQNGEDGWTLQGQTVTILGTTCQSILDGQALDVRVVAGCPTLQR